MRNNGATDARKMVRAYLHKLGNAPSPEAAEKTGLPVGAIVEVMVLDPYFYK
jgi:hypothetical protein